MKKLLIFIAMLFVCVGTVQAKTVDHFYGMIDSDIKSEDKVAGSTVLAGANVQMDGSADGVSFLLGNQVVFNGDSEYAVFAGNSIEVDGQVNKDAFIAGNLIDIKKGAKLNRDVVIAGADVKISGTISRNISVYASSVSFDGVKIEGNVKVYATSLKVDSDTQIGGNLSYPSDAEASIEKGAVKGEIIKTKEIQNEEESLANLIMNKIWSFMSVILIFAVLSLAASKMFINIQNEYEKFDFNKGMETFTKGLLFLIFVPIVIFILLLMTIGIPLALILLALYFIIVYLSTVFTGYLLGFKLWQKFFNKDINMLVVGIFGYAILFILNLIPGISFIVSMLSTIIGIGIIYDVVIKKMGAKE